MIALMVAHNLAVELNISRKVYRDLTAAERPAGYLVASALAVVNFDLIAWRPNKSPIATWASKYVTEPKLFNSAEPVTHSDQPACSVRILPADHLEHPHDQVEEGGPGLPGKLWHEGHEQHGHDCHTYRQDQLVPDQPPHGPGSGHPLIVKIIATNPLLNAALSGDGTPATFIHRASHWASTHIVLNTLSFWTGRLLLRSPCGQKPALESVKVSSDFAIQVKALPAGTGPNHIIHATLSKHGGNRIWALCGQALFLLMVAQGVQSLIDRSVTSFADHRVDERLLYHVGALSLTGHGQKTLNASRPSLQLGASCSTWPRDPR